MDGSPLSFDIYQKPRMTIDPSAGDNPLNASIGEADRRVAFPHLRGFAGGAAIVDEAARRSGLRGVLYVADIKSA